MGIPIDHSFLNYKKELLEYPGDEATAAFAEKLADYEVSKGTIRLPHDRDLPEKLIADIAKWCYASYAKRRIIKKNSFEGECYDDKVEFMPEAAKVNGHMSML